MINFFINGLKWILVNLKICLSIYTIIPTNIIHRRYLETIFQ